MKKFLSALVAVASMACLPIGAVHASEPLVHSQENAISPRYSYTNSTYTYLTISSNGTASVTASLLGYQGVTTKVTIYVYLEQYTSGSWRTVDSWSDTFNFCDGDVSGSTTVTKGYKYRARASYYAYSGSKNETFTEYSKEVSY